MRCGNCGYTSPKWNGRILVCASCGAAEWVYDAADWDSYRKPYEPSAVEDSWAFWQALSMIFGWVILVGLLIWGAITMARAAETTPLEVSAFVVMSSADGGAPFDGLPMKKRLDCASRYLLAGVSLLALIAIGATQLSAASPPAQLVRALALSR